MGLWSKIKGKETQFKGPPPPAVGQVLLLLLLRTFVSGNGKKVVNA